MHTQKSSFSRLKLSFVLAAGLMAAMPDLELRAQTPAKPTTDLIEVMNILRPVEIALTRDLKRAATVTDPVEKDRIEQEAYQRIYDVQARIGDIFGPGSEAPFTFTHRGKSYTVYIDCDAALLRLTSKGFVVMTTMGVMEPVHLAVMQDQQGNPAEEAKVSQMATTMMYPLYAPEMNAARFHLFAADKSRDETHRGTHNVDPAVITRVEKEILEPFTVKVNLKLRAALQAQPPAPR